MPEFDSFAKALMAYFDPPKVTVAEVRHLTAKDRQELSRLLNDAGYEHPPYQAPVAA